VNEKTSSVVLVTGFERFGPYDINPSQLIAVALNGTQIGNVSIYGLVLPVDFNLSTAVICNAVSVLHPVLVVSVGLKARTHVITIERQGINLKRDPAAQGSEQRLHRISTQGPFIEASSLPIRKMVTALRTDGISSRQSWFAGTYVCNSVYYTTLKYVDQQGLDTPVLFVHVPLSSSQDPKGMNLDTMVKAIKIMIQIGVQNTTT
jgi:pyroglutamyl-peptidase